MAKLRVDKIAAPIIKDEYTGSVFFDGNGDYLSVGNASDADWAFGTDPFTVEHWIYWHSVGNGQLLSPGMGGETNAWYWQYYSSQLQWGAQGVASDLTYSFTPTANTWYHIAVSRDSANKMRFFIDGVEVTSGTVTRNYVASASPLLIANGGAGYFTGYMSNVRICKGHAVYTRNFTVPTRELEVHLGAKGVVFPAADNRTVLLACQDAYNPLTEATGRHTITGAGSLGGVPEQNLVTNGDFHSNSNWDNYVSPTTSEISTDQSYDGTNSWKIVADEALDGISQTFSSNSFTGRKYLLSGYLYSSTGEARIRWRNGADGAWLYDANVGNGTANVWQKFEITATESNGGSNMGVRLTANGSGTFYFDRISVVAVHPVTDANPGLLRKTNVTSTITETTGSVYFDGTSDGLRSNPYDELIIGTGAFTVECWFWRQNITDSWGSLVSDNLYSGAGGWDLYTQYNDIRFYVGGVGEVFTVSDCYSAQTWTHVAAQRDSSGNMSCYINGVEKGVTATNSTDYTDNRILIGGNNSPAGSYPNYVFNGYISNVRVCRGHNVYTSNFAPPTRELEVHPGPSNDKTILLACYDGENVFAEKTGKIIAATGDRVSSPTPTATDSPIGSTTVTPGLTREVDPTEGPTFGGGVGFVSQNWLTLPKGTTTQRSRGRGLVGGGYISTYINTIEYIEIHTLGNGQDFGDLSTTKAFVTATSSSTRCLFHSGYDGSNGRFEIDYVNISTTGNAVNFATSLSSQWSRAGCGNNTRGIVASGSASNLIEYVTFSTLGQTNDFGDYAIGQHRDHSGCSSPTRGIFAGGFNPTNTNSIQYVTISTVGNSQDFGDLSSARGLGTGAASSATRGVFFGGSIYPSSGGTNIIEYITISTQGNTTDFGDLTRSTYRSPCTSNGTRAVIYSSSPSPGSNAIEYVTIATTGNASDFGDSFISAREYSDCASSDSHGGIS